MSWGYLAISPDQLGQPCGRDRSAAGEPPSEVTHSLDLHVADGTAGGPLPVEDASAVPNSYNHLIYLNLMIIPGCARHGMDRGDGPARRCAPPAGGLSQMAIISESPWADVDRSVRNFRERKKRAGRGLGRGSGPLEGSPYSREQGGEKPRRAQARGSRAGPGGAGRNSICRVLLGMVMVPFSWPGGSTGRTLALNEGAANET